MLVVTVSNDQCCVLTFSILLLACLVVIMSYSRTGVQDAGLINIPYMFSGHGRPDACNLLAVTQSLIKWEQLLVWHELTY